MSDEAVEHANGVRVVTLYIPFKAGDKDIKVITLGPVTFDFTLRWQEGEFRNSFDLLCALVVEGETVVRKIRYPDVERVLEQFMSMIPAQIRTDIMNGSVPIRQPGEEPPLPPEPPIEELSQDEATPAITPLPEELEDDGVGFNLDGKQ